jgi:hypothetical protein
MECGDEFLERNNDIMYRINDASAPSEIPLSGSTVDAKCGKCQQKYHVHVSLNVRFEQGGIPMHLQPQSVYITVDNAKKLRYVHCLECGKVFHSISDRISQVVDNRIPFELVDPGKIGILEALCHAQHCGQTWALMI